MAKRSLARLMAKNMASGQKSTRVPKAVKKYVNKKMSTGGEKKQFTTYNANTLISTSVGTGYPCNVPTSAVLLGQGPGDYSRIGSKINITELSFSTYVQLGIGQQSDTVRIMVIIDKYANGVAPIMGDILYNVAAGNSCSSPYKQGQRTTYKILSDKIYNIHNDVVSSATANNLKLIRFRKKFKTPIQTQFYANAGAFTIADIQKNSIFVVAFSGVGYVTFLNFQSSILFTDD